MGGRLQSTHEAVGRHMHVWINLATPQDAAALGVLRRVPHLQSQHVAHTCTAQREPPDLAALSTCSRALVSPLPWHERRFAQHFVS